VVRDIVAVVRHSRRQELVLVAAVIGRKERHKGDSKMRLGLGRIGAQLVLFQRGERSTVGFHPTARSAGGPAQWAVGCVRLGHSETR
jgi:hypothetical protein